MSYHNNVRTIDQDKIVMGFWHNWTAGQGQGYKGGRFTEMSLTEIPAQYNVIAVAFMKVDDGSSDLIPDFKPYKYSDAEFRAQIDALHAQGRKVLISLGGADAHIALQPTDEDAFTNRIIELVERYGFDGLDIDLEQSAITAAANQQVIPAALKRVKDYYRPQGKNFIISMAPEFPYLVKGREYNAYIQALEGYYDFIAPQFYNQGGDGVYVDGLGWLAQNNDDMKSDFLFYLTESLVTGTRGFIKIPHDKFVIGLPTNNDAAATGYVKNPQDLLNALHRLEDANLPVKGIMTWSVNWDNGFDSSGKAYNWEFIKRYGHLSENGGDSPATAPDAPVNLTSPSQTQNEIKLTWQSTTGNQKIASYLIYRDGIRTGTSATTEFTDTGLQPATVYRYQVSAVDSAGNSSPLSLALTVSTLAEPVSYPEWQENTKYSENQRVSWLGKNYICVMPHTSNIYWTPEKAITLWQPFVN